MRELLRGIIPAIALVTVTPHAAAAAATAPVSINFVDADIGSVARMFASLLRREIVVDPRVRGAVTLTTDKELPVQQAFDRFVGALRMSGYSVVEASGTLKIVPESDAKLAGDVVSTDIPPGGGHVVTHVFQLTQETASNLVPVLRPLIGPNSVINAHPSSNALIVTDYADNLRRVGKLIAALDVAGASEFEVVRLRYAIAVEIAPLVQRLAEGTLSSANPVAGSPAGASDAPARVVVIAEPRTNTLLLRAATLARLQAVHSIAARLDEAAADQPDGDIHVIHLRNADAVRVAAILRAAMLSPSGAATGGAANGASSVTTAPSSVANAASSAGSTSVSGAASGALAAAAQPSTGGQIQADPQSNALIITAPEQQFKKLKAVVERLDGRRAQVLVESLIVEVSAEKAAEFGVQWQNILGNSSSSLVGYVGSNFGSGGSNIISLNTGLADGSTLPSTGMNIGIGRKVGDTYVLGLLARFFQSNGDGNVLSTPTLLTLDNEEARIVVGQNVPFVTGQYTSSSSSSSTVNPFQTIERKDVGLTLRVKPQVAEDGAVRLTIFHEVSSVQASSANNTNGPTTNKRTIESNVVVQDGAVVVLGGLLQDEYSGSEEKVPGASSVPILGNLFRTESRSRKKTNLMVFLRPVVLRDPATAEALSRSTYERARLLQERAQPTPSMLVPVEASPLLERHSE